MNVGLPPSTYILCALSNKVKGNAWGCTHGDASHQKERRRKMDIKVG